ncbi:Zinc finger, PHD-type [Corchorus olitorius]|uniref:Zinc finger, PHD-type n=1 Tax=Corchorus olitorius TaxID=93759 RepID=A0A1R3J6B4_9ROSI|nr:Zinc finger, PHD-type [Corchorus olitorius]
MANGKDAEDFVVLSRVRTGLKREFEFALKVQAEICGSLGRTRSKKVHTGPVWSPGRRSNKKLKREAEKDKGDLEEPVRAVEELVDLMSEEEAKSDVVDVEEPKRDVVGSEEEESKRTELEKEEEVKDGVVEPMCEDEIDKEGKEKAEPEEAAIVSQEETQKGEEMEEEKDKEKEEEEVEEPKMDVDVGEKEGELENVSKEGQLQNVSKEGELENASKEGELENALKEGELVNVSKESEQEHASKNLEVGKGKEDLVVQSDPCEGDLGRLPLVSCEGDSKVEEVVKVEKPLRRFTRSMLKPKVEPVEASDLKSGADDDRAESVDSPLKQETNVSTKTLRNFPTKLKDLFDSGMLEGLNVRYTRSSKITRASGTRGLQGVITGSGILCFCSACNGVNIVAPTLYEIHAGSSNKRPAEYIYLENGSTLRDIMIACKENPLTTLENALRMVIGSSMKNSSFCLNCRESLSGVVSEKPVILCNSCLDVKGSRGSLIDVADTTDRSPKPTVVSKSLISPLKCSSSQTKGKVTRKDLRMHKLVFEENGLPDGAEVAYFVRGKKMLVGYKKGFGILCTCCNAEISPSQFEAHAGWATRRKPFQHIYTSNGVSLHELSISLLKSRKFSTNENDDLCSICLDGGNLLCCDTCPRAFHKDCVSLPIIPTGIWHCRYCQNTFQKEKFVEHNANAIAAGRVAGIDPIEQITKRCIRIIKTPETEVISVCVLCRGHAYSRSGFGPRTVILCDQCEREYHVGCLREHNMADLKELPKGKWFCCNDCNKIHCALQKLVLRGEEKLPDSSLLIVKKKHEESGTESKANLDIRWRVLSGKMTSSDDTRVLLSKAVSIFHERFDPISDSGSTKGDLIPSMVYGRTVKGQDFGGMYCAILTVNQVVVSAGIFRIFGQEVAEIPLVATSTECQGQGYFQCLFNCIEKLLGFLNVKNLVLPAADEAESIWTSKFGFGKVTQEELSQYKRDYQMMIFQGTSILQKPVPGIRLITKSEAE